MIFVTRFHGPRFAVNPDLLERVESTPDTVLTLIDGTKFVVEEPVEEVIERIRGFRASVIASAHALQLQPAADEAPGADGAGERPRLAAVPSPAPSTAERRS